MKSAEEFLQFLYDMNIICFFEKTEDETFLRWCYQERSLTNISPKIKTESEYEIHYGLANVLNTGKKLKARRRGPAADSEKADDDLRRTGTIKFYRAAEGYGFIIQRDLPIDIHFTARDIEGDGADLMPGDTVTYELVKNAKRQLAVKSIRKTGKKAALKAAK